MFLLDSVIHHVVLKMGVIGSTKKLLGQKEAKPIFVAIFNSFSWYFPLYIFFVNILDSLPIEYNTLLLIYFVHYMTIVISALFGNFLASKLKRRNLLSLWMLIGTIVSLSMLLMKSGEIGWIYFISIFLGFSLGLGFPSCLAYFADNTNVEHRGSFGGILYFLASMGMAVIGFSTTLLDFFVAVLLFTIWRAIGLVAFLLSKPKNEQKAEIADVSYGAILHERAFIVYFIPWTMFCLINFLEIPFFDVPLQQYFLGTNLRYLISIGEFGIGGLSALIGGLLSDKIGRKRMIISAFIMVGIGYAVLSLSFSSPIVLYFYVLLDGVAWGIFALMFYLIIWGDLAVNRSKEKYYLIGTLPFLISSFISFLVTPYAGAVPLTTAFSLASFFLFLAVLPLIYAPETLPEKTIKERELKTYIEKAKKAKEKYA
jgi:MFS family permease